MRSSSVSATPQFSTIDRSTRRNEAFFGNILAAQVDGPTSRPAAYIAFFNASLVS
jgi:hypothetical protein